MLDTVVRGQNESAGLLLSERPLSRKPLPTPAELALWVVLATVTMLFAGFTSAYLVRRTASDWVPIYAPPILWLNTLLIVLSSVTLEVSKFVRRARHAHSAQLWLLASALLGAAFVAGQVFAWEQLRASGIFLPTSPHSSFFYMLTGVHATHVLGGLAALLYVLRREWHPPSAVSAVDPTALVATYWHFVTGVWLFLYVLLFIWR